MIEPIWSATLCVSCGGANVTELKFARKRRKLTGQNRRATLRQEKLTADGESTGGLVQHCGVGVDRGAGFWLELEGV
ncbi:hypothetical protein L6164_002054 [Bauhinia variegata]|uniref:Uncharacterized protein n=1 Tax=Bauhinia variegata TaxID=167791 RepID=A0ACB9PWH2_BAUVA|nr:hypothetical protein L6164_002054 [Bauhinia variegata]